MRIGINALFLIPEVVGGSETYTRNLVQALAHDYAHDAIFVFCNRESKGTFGGLAPNVEEVACPVRATFRPGRILYEQLVLPWIVRRHHIDVLLSPGETSPYIKMAPSVITIHDMQCYRVPERYSWHYLLASRFFTRLSAARADELIADSRASADDVVRYGLARGRALTVVHLGVHEAFFDPISPESAQSMLAAIDVRPPFVLTVSSSYPHKNLARLIRAFARLEPDTGCQLVIVGPVRPHEAQAMGESSRLRDPARIRRLDRVSLATLRALYQAAELFVLPSLYEGFGLPLLEAMAGGTCVVCSRIPVFSEVAGDAAAFFDPRSEDDIARVILGLLRSPPERERLRRAGRNHAAQYSWARTARQTRAVLERAHHR